LVTALPSGWRLWLAGARPRTLPAAVVPVAVGTASVAGEAFSAIRALLALIVALALQIATNYANDYSDGVRGTDADRTGPLRLVGSGLASPAAVKRATIVAFGSAALAGLVLAVLVTPWLLVVGACSMAAGWFYTGGSNPYGYLGWGEVFVFVFFGLVATIGSAYVQVERVDTVTVALAVAVGLFATALLVANNLRDRRGDAAAGKRTLAVRVGDRATRAIYLALMAGAFVVIAAVALSADRGWVALGLLAAPLALRPAYAVATGAVGRSLIPVLEATGQVQAAAGAGMAIGLLV